MKKNYIESEELIDSYKTAFNMLIKAFSNNEFNLQESFKECLFYLNADAISLYKLNDNQFELIDKIHNINYPAKRIHFFLNQYRNEQNFIQRDFFLKHHIIKRITILPIKTTISNYFIVIVNNNLLYNANIHFTNLITNTYRIVLEKKEAIDEINRMRTIDALTKVNNRNSYIEDTEKIDLKKRKLSYAIIDLFSLKTINDKYGHYKGDEYISLVATLLRKTFATPRNKNKIYRIGGDEFVVICPNEDANYLENRFEIINNTLEECQEKFAQDAILRINYGIASTFEGIDSFNELYKTADKRQGEEKAKTYQKLKIDRRRIF